MSSSRPSQAGGDSEVSGVAGAELVPAHRQRVWRERDFAAPVPESLARPAIVWVRHDQIEGDPFNIRDHLPSVQRMAWSIYRYSLLENLIVVENPNDKSRAEGKEYQLRAGSRRFEAIRLLIDGVEAPPGSADRESGIKWYWPADRGIPCHVLGSDGHYEHLIENIERSDPHPWEIGRRLNEALNAGVSSRELGTSLGRSNGWVTRYAHIGRGLAPELIELLRTERVELKLGELAQLAAIRDPFGDPDGEAQILAFRERRARRRRRPRRIDPHSFRATIKRMQYLRADMPVPPILRPTVTAIIEYLEGGGRPGFRDLEAQLFDQVRAFSPHIETEDFSAPDSTPEGASP